MTADPRDPGGGEKEQMLPGVDEPWRGRQGGGGVFGGGGRKVGESRRV